MQLQELIQLPQLAACRLLASPGDLHRNVTWVTVYELLDELELVEPGDLILTDGFDLLSYQDDYPALCRRVQKQQAAALGLVAGGYVSQLPPALLQAAWEAGLPILFLSGDHSVAQYSTLIIQQLASRKPVSATAGSTATHCRVICLAASGEMPAAFLPALCQSLPPGCRTRPPEQGQGQIFLCLEGRLPDPRTLRECFCSSLSAEKSSLLSAGVSEVLAVTADLAEAKSQAVKALALGQALSGPGKMAFYENIALYEAFLGHPSSASPLGYSAAMLDRLAAYDAAHHGELITTLETYIQSDGNSRQAAARLGIHRHTLKNRLEKIEELTACPLAGPGRVNYEVALAYHHLYRIKL